MGLVSFHAFKHYDVYNRYRGPPVPEWAEQEAQQFERSVEPEGAAAARARYGKIAQQQGMVMHGLHMLPIGMMPQPIRIA